MNRDMMNVMECGDLASAIHVVLMDADYLFYYFFTFASALRSFRNCQHCACVFGKETSFNPNLKQQ